MKRYISILILSCIIAVTKAQNYNIMNYGAKSDTTLLSTTAIQRAIDECSSKGGGTVLVPAGNYLSTTIMLKDNVNLYLDNGATIYASRKISDYGGEKVSVGAADNDFIEVLVSANNVKNISVTGKGTLNCRAERVAYRREPKTNFNDSITGREILNAIKYGVDYRDKFKKVPPFTGAINFTGCENVHIEDIQVIESSFWSVHLQWCDRVYVNGIYIYSNPDNGVNADGLDIDGCSNVMISDCNINTGDDALCLKTTNRDGYSRACNGIAITNCILTSSSAALKFGTESNNNFENITISNCVIKDANRGINMIMRDGGAIRNVTISNITINTIRKATFWWGNGDPIWLTIQSRNNHPSGGNIENVTLQNIIAHGQSGIRVEGFSNRLNNIHFNNIQLFIEPESAKDKRARDGYLFDGVNNLYMKDCSLVWSKEKVQKEWENAYKFKNIDGLYIKDVIGEKSPNKGYEIFYYENVNRAKIEK